MLEASWLLFVLASLVVIATPGQDSGAILIGLGLRLAPERRT
jgi:hypothetical protein